MVNGRVSEHRKAWSQAALGRALGLSAPSVTKLKKLGMPVDSIESAREWRERRLNIAQRKPEPGPERFRPPPREAGSERDETRDEARTRREMLAKQEAGELVFAAEVRAEFAKAVAAVRDSLLNLPGRLAPVVAAEADPRLVQSILDAEIRAALGKLAG
jgi:hypothetical protein